jgi:alkylation response protein AidB-like acyl-CoA dehydrogenase
VDFSESEHHAMLRESLVRFGRRHIPPGAVAKWEKAGSIDRSAFRALADLGVMGLCVPVQYGGTGRDIVGMILVIDELSRLAVPLCTLYTFAACYGGMTIADLGSEAQKAEILPKVVSGDIMLSYGWTEPDVGSDLPSVQTTARREGDKLIINGAKRFCSGADVTDYILALVRTGPVDQKYKNLSLVLVPNRSDGITITPIETLGHHGVGTTDVTFQDVEVPFGNILGGPEKLNQGWQTIAQSMLDIEKIEAAAGGLGVARAALEEARNYSMQRVQFGSEIAKIQDIRHKIADMEVNAHTAHLVTYHAAWALENGLPCSKQTSIAKLHATEAARTNALLCLQIMGAYGYTKDFDCERLVRDALLLPIAAGSSAIQRNNIAHLSGLPRVK